MLDICDLQAIGQCCIKNGHNSVMGSTSNKTNKVCMYGDMYIYCLWIYSLHIWKDTIGTQFFEHSSPLIFQQDNTELYTASSTTAWLFSRRVGSKLACLQSRPFTSWTRLKRQETKSMWKISQNCWNSQNGTTLLSTPASWCPQFPGVYGLFLRDTNLFWDALLFLHSWKVELKCSKTD